jgi:hypothetical protein
MAYDFKINHSQIKKGTVESEPIKAQHIQSDLFDAKTRDLIIYAVLARFALNNNENIEFETVFDEETQTVELVIPDDHLDIFDQMTGMKRGPNFTTYIDWLIGSQTLTAGGSALRDANFIGVSEISAWTGATRGFINDQLTLTLPLDCFATIGQNFKSRTNEISVYLNWMFLNGSNTDYSIKLSVNDNTTEVVTATTVNISTFNLVSGDIRESLLGTFAVTDGGLVSINIQRNFSGSTDPQTELVAVLGFRIE